MGYPNDYQFSGGPPVFDPCPHLIRLIIIRCGELLYPGEKNISVLVEKVSEAIGLAPFQLSADQSWRFRAPQQPGAGQAGVIIEAIKPEVCPNCGKESVRLFSICQSCDELSENKKYKSVFACKYNKLDARSGKPVANHLGLPILVEGCGYLVKSEKSMTEWLDEKGIEYKNQTKRSLGIQTISEKGVE